MSFNPMPMNPEERRKRQLAAAQRMLTLIDSLGSYSEQTLPKYDYGGQAMQLGNDISRDFAASLLFSQPNGGMRTGAVERRLNRRGQ